MAARKALPRVKIPAALKRYSEKRRFDVTTEPGGATSATRHGDSFVIQQHDATKMHFDFRLELDGVLVSWAIPKGPSLSPSDKRLAVQTEDHPVSYRGFEGNIPHGEYGGGPVIVWDKGRWTPETDPRAGMKKGELKFSLHGEKIKGSFALIRIRGKVSSGPKSNWLLIKHADEHARKGKAADITRLQPASVISGRTVKEIGSERDNKTAPLKSRSLATPPTKLRKTVTAASRQRRVSKSSDRSRRGVSTVDLGDIQPQLATLAARPPRSGNWLYEIKFDGYRMLAGVEKGRVQLRSRNNLDWSDTFPDITRALSQLDVGSVVLDGEVCYVTPEGKSSFRDLQGVLPRGGGTIPTDKQKCLVYFIFDVLIHDGLDVRPETLVERKQRLRILLGKKLLLPLVFSEHIEGAGTTSLNQACAAGLEGLIAKRMDAPYREGRSTDWIKLKCTRQQEFVIVGFLPAQGNRKGFRSLLLGAREGGTLRYAGKVGTGFDGESLRQIASRLRTIIVAESAVVDPPKMKGVIWIKPDFVCEVAFTEVTNEGLLRHPSFQGLRQDKSAKKRVRKKAVTLAKIEASVAVPERDEFQGVRISHPDRVVDAKSGLTKGELAEYHDLVSPLLMPYARNRPLALVRCPQGDAHGCFFQKHKMPGLGKSVKQARVANHPILYTQTPAGIMELVQFNAIELHGWGATMADTLRPDWLVIDLDPDASLPFSAVVDAALEVRDALAGVGIRTFVKTTGGRGLHVVLPIEPTVKFDAAKELTRGIAEALAANAPERYVAKMTKAKRVGKIFVDYLRNGQGATAVLPYSPRARPGAPIAMPIAWKDLRRIDPQEFTVRSAKDWLKKRRRDPWAEFFEISQRLPELSGSDARSK